MRNIIAIMKKQWMDTLKNKPVLIQFIIFPVMAVIMTKFVEVPGMSPTYFIKMFAGMFVGMSPLVATSSILSEGKDEGTLRVLFMSNVKSGEYLLAIGSYVFLLSMAGAGVMCLAGGYTGFDALIFLGILAIGILTSILIGAAIGAFSKNQMVATSIMTPLMMVFAFVPMIGGFNEQVQKVILMPVSIILCLGITIYFFGWFPTGSPLPWMLFVVSFLMCFGISVAISLHKNKKADAVLNKALEEMK